MPLLEIRYFAAAGWKEPHRYPDKDCRSNISSFHLTGRATVESSVERLKVDLENGRRDKLYGKVLQMSKIYAGYNI